MSQPMTHHSSPSDSDAPAQRLRVICVDDETNVLKSLQRLLKRASFEVTVFTDPVEALQHAHKNPFDVIISDMRMPQMSGAELLTLIAQSHPDCYRILLTGYSDPQDTMTAVNEGGIHHYLNKPWDNASLLSVLAKASAHLRLEEEKRQQFDAVTEQNEQLNTKKSELEQQVELRTRMIRKAMTRLEKANARILRERDETLQVFYNMLSLNPNLGGESAVTVSDLCLRLAQQMEIEEAEVTNIRLAGKLSELGLLSYPEALITKPFMEMTREEKQEYLAHPEKAFHALSPAANLHKVADIIRHQFEQIDGKGIPSGLVESDIPIGSRILAVARDFIGYTTGRIIATRTTAAKALELMEAQSNVRYDAEILRYLPESVDDLSALTPTSDETLISIDQLEPGMVIARDLFNRNHILMLPEGHELTVATLKRLQENDSINQDMRKVYVYEPAEEEEL